MGSLFDDTVVFSSSSSSSFSSPLLSFPVPDYFDVLRPLHFPGSLAQTLQLEQSAFRVNPQKVLFVLRFAGSCRLGERKNTKKMSKSRGKKTLPQRHGTSRPILDLSFRLTAPSTSCFGLLGAGVTNSSIVGSFPFCRPLMRFDGRGRSHDDHEYPQNLTLFITHDPVRSISPVHFFPPFFFSLPGISAGGDYP